MIDFHSHLLPGIDDGSKNIKMSVAMLKEGKKQGVEISVATPHYYFDKPIDKMLKKRKTAYDKLIKYAEKNKLEFPEIVLGFEVYLSDDIYRQDELEKLLINGTNTMLVEMPYEKWTDRDFARLDFLAEKEFNIILAHPERHMTVNGEKEYNRLFDYGFAGQLNAASLVNPKTREFAYKLIKDGRIKVLGSDAHNLGTRANFMGLATEFIRKNLGEQYLQKINEETEHYLGFR